MDVSTIAELFKTFGLAGMVAILAIWALIQKDKQCTAMMEKVSEIAKDNAVAAQQVATSLETLREAIRLGTRQ